MRYLFGALALLPVAHLVVGTVRGRRPIDACCAAPEADGRISAAVADGGSGPSPAGAAP